MALIETASVTGQTLYAILRNSEGAVWNGSAFEAYVQANWTTYDMAMTEQGASGYYSAAFPASISTAGRYTFLVYAQSGAGPVVADEVIGSGSIDWEGTEEEAEVVVYASDEAALLAQLAALNTLITAKLSGGVVANWRVGDVSFNEADSVETLIEFRKSLLDQLRSIPSEYIDVIHNAVDTFGNDGTEYLGDWE